MSADHFHRGDAHLRVTGCKAKHQSFFTLDEARDWMGKNVTGVWKESIKDVDGETTPLRNSTVSDQSLISIQREHGSSERDRRNLGCLSQAL